MWFIVFLSHLLCDQISRAEGNVAVFKSTFFGTFGSDALFSPPTPINFVDIFLNFSEKLQQTPQVLAAEVFLIIFFIAIVIPLRRADQKDRLLVSQTLSICQSTGVYIFKTIILKQEYRKRCVKWNRFFFIYLGFFVINSQNELNQELVS